MAQAGEPLVIMRRPLHAATNTEGIVNIPTVIQLVLGSILIGVGVLKLVKGKSLAGNAGMGWMQDFSTRAIAAIGIAEVVAGGAMLGGALLTNRHASLLGAGAGAIIMAGAAYTHLRRKEYGAMLLPAVLGAACLVIAALLLRGEQ
ncbi:MAG: DoxX family protein [Gemmatimonadaceae bacterium]|nr:DoxX family protein [Gemmatimonadaceae bacterium]